jgi:hypothetical protein
VKKQVLELVESCSKIDDRDEASRLLPSPSSPIFPAPLANYRPWYALTDKHAIQRRHLSPTKSTAQPPATHLHVATPVAAPRLSVASSPSPAPAASPPPAASPCSTTGLARPLTWASRQAAAPTMSHARRSSNPLRPRHLPCSSAMMEQSI